MNIQLIKADLCDAYVIHDMQIKAFLPLLEKYQDDDTSPANETVDHIIFRLNQPTTDYYLINRGDRHVGAIRIVHKEEKNYRISPIFILPEFQGQKIAQKVFAIIEDLYDDAHRFELDTILEEQGNCYLYEKLGYKKTGQRLKINDRMTIVYYEKFK